MFRKKGIRVKREQWLKSIPIRTVEEYEVDDKGNIVIIVEVVEKGVIAKILNLFSIIPPPRYKKIVLDKIGSKIWLLCDGKHTIEDIIKSVIKETGLSRRNIEIAVYTYINQLIMKGLLQLQLPIEGGSNG